ncbi:MAG: hypothetical protein J6K72_09600 [Clostridia bacterium]|nr:hypothetical protein [Clostridia bacterium]
MKKFSFFLATLLFIMMVNSAFARSDWKTYENLGEIEFVNLSVMNNFNDHYEEYETLGEKLLQLEYDETTEIFFPVFDEPFLSDSEAFELLNNWFSAKVENEGGIRRIFFDPETEKSGKHVHFLIYTKEGENQVIFVATRYTSEEEAQKRAEHGICFEHWLIQINNLT